MIIGLLKNPNFNGELYKTHFVEGVSQEHVNQHTFDLIKNVLGLEPYIIKSDVECDKCEEYKQRIKELEAKLTKKTTK